MVFLTARVDKFWSQCHSKRAAEITPSLSSPPIRHQNPSSVEPHLLHGSRYSNFGKLQTHSNLWQLFTFLSGKLVGEGATRGCLLGAIRVKKKTTGGGVRENRPREMPRRWDGPGKQGFAGPSSVSPSSSHSHHFIPSLPEICWPQNSGLCSPLPSAPPTHYKGFSLPH